ncbi:MAG TPA: pyridoxal-phosphate dependent enzyme [Candidatus Polarisedimenticolia bacterium]|nr:pyridoxal-phosphate dependent enzyme [Candidatus Polarisedimenticolia bacterium]
MSGHRCDDCGRRLSSLPLPWRCPCGGPLSVAGRGRFDPRAVASRPPTLWRYREAIGVGLRLEPVTLGEGMTPIVQREVAGLPARFKLEFLMPTGSFKDRGATVVLSQMAASGISRAVEDSSGNAGAAMAAYGARAGIEVDVLVPHDAPGPKLAAIEAHGGKVQRIHGGRAAASAEALRRAEAGLPFASHVWHPCFLEGTRTFAYEVWEQCGAMPARIFFPVGNGSLLIGAFDGFVQLLDEGLIRALPRLMAVQASACAPFLAAQGDPPEAGATIADGIRIARPPRHRRIREAVSRSGGAFLAVDDEAIQAARHALCRAGLGVEPTSAAALAGALQWRCEAGPAAARESEEPGGWLIPLTGTGLKVAA